MLAGQTKAEMLASAETCQLLLIVGQPLKTPAVLDLSRELADIVHKRSGAVVYISCEPLKGRNLYDFIDAQLQVAVPELVRRVSQEIAKVWSSSLHL